MDRMMAHWKAIRWDNQKVTMMELMKVGNMVPQMASMKDILLD